MTTTDPCLCACGCGLARPLYLRNHNHRQHGHTVEDRGYETPCWIATKPPDANGYVTYRWSADGRTATRIGAHRVAYLRAKGPIPTGYHVHHRCCVTNCVNPDHLDAVPPKDNVRATRQVKLNPELVRTIRASDKINVELARELGVSAAAISLVRRRKTWTDVED